MLGDYLGQLPASTETSEDRIRLKLQFDRIIQGSPEGYYTYKKKVYYMVPEYNVDHGYTRFNESFSKVYEVGYMSATGKFKCNPQTIGRRGRLLDVQNEKDYDTKAYFMGNVEKRATGKTYDSSFEYLGTEVDVTDGSGFTDYLYGDKNCRVKGLSGGKSRKRRSPRRKSSRRSRKSRR